VNVMSSGHGAHGPSGSARPGAWWTLIIAAAGGNLAYRGAWRVVQRDQWGLMAGVSEDRGFVQASGRSAIRLRGQLLSWSGRWVALVVGEVAEQVLIWRSLGDGVDQQLATDEGALP
jgi:hypothetical protein